MCSLGPVCSTSIQLLNHLTEVFRFNSIYLLRTSFISKATHLNPIKPLFMFISFGTYGKAVNITCSSIGFLADTFKHQSSKTKILN